MIKEVSLLNQGLHIGLKGLICGGRHSPHPEKMRSLEQEDPW